MKKTISALAASLLATVAFAQDESEAAAGETAVPEVQKAPGSSDTQREVSLR